MAERHPKDYRLFHYTPKLEYLLDMLVEGVWPRYCEEDFGWLVGKPACLAIPMVCFCDIPVDAADNHQSTYGSYAVSINKASAGMLDINPVWYVHDKSSIAKHVQESIVTQPRFNVANNNKNNMFRTLAYIKPTIGAQPSRSVNGSTSILSFEEEMEWRYTPKKLHGEWRSATRSGFVTDDDHERSSRHRLMIKLEQIENIFVTTPEEVSAVISQHPSLAGKVSTWV